MGESQCDHSIVDRGLTQHIRLHMLPCYDEDDREKEHQEHDQGQFKGRKFSFEASSARNTMGPYRIC